MPRMTSWLRGALGVGLSVAVAVGCGDDTKGPTTSSPAAEAGAAGQSEEPGAAGMPSLPPGGSGSGTGGEAGAAGVTHVDLASYCQLVSKAHYAWLSYCEGAAQYPEAGAGDFVEKARTRCLRARSSVDAGRLAFDEDAARACVLAIDVENCSGFDFIAGLAECQGVFTPLAELGDECFADWTHSIITGGAASECSNGYCATSDKCPGECVAFISDGEPCALSSECHPDSYCGDEGCTPRKANFGECSGDACQRGSSCVYPPNQMFGICMDRSTAEQACSESEPCSAGFYCIAGACRSKVGTGEPCLLSRNCLDGERCLERNGAGPTCGPPGDDGVPCLALEDCAATHYCPISAPRECTARVALGEPCLPGQCVAGAWCNSEAGECQAQGGEGDSCLVGGSPAGTQACQPPLYCMGNGECRGVGGEGDPCNTTEVGSCTTGLFCSRADFTCHPAGAEGELCNPFSPVSCAAELGCLCSDPACEPDGADPKIEDSFHTCLPRRATGEQCFRDEECAIGSSCLGGAAGVCSPDPVECLPE
jgi:hypothetical protein